MVFFKVWARMKLERCIFKYFGYYTLNYNFKISPLFQQYMTKYQLSKKFLYIPIQPCCSSFTYPSLQSSHPLGVPSEHVESHDSSHSKKIIYDKALNSHHLYKFNVDILPNQYHRHTLTVADPDFICLIKWEQVCILYSFR